MNDDFLITIKGTQIVDGESNDVEVMTVGSYETKNDKRYIIYKEYGKENDTPKTTIIKFENNDKVSIISPNNKHESRLILEKDRRHLCHYETPMGGLMVGVSTHDIFSTLDDNGGILEVSYTLDFNTNEVSKNSFYINVKKNNNK